MTELYTPKPAPWRELGALYDATTLPLFWKDCLTQQIPRGGERVLVLPGFMTGDTSTLVLRMTLKTLGHDVHGWGLGLNRGDVWALAARVEQRVRKLASHRPIHLIGWSLGGVLAREVARRAPDDVAQVITLGTPVVGGPFYTAAAGFYVRRVPKPEELKARIEARERVPIRVPVTALYSARDAVVCPAACVDAINTHIQHIPIDCRHAGFGFHSTVFRIIADRLHRPPKPLAPGAPS
ncbi:MAG: alpha/beta fold hydrolase [Myxococcota bacterium]